MKIFVARKTIQTTNAIIKFEYCAQSLYACDVAICEHMLVKFEVKNDIGIGAVVV